MAETAEEWLLDWEQIGLPPHPLRGKLPACKGWRDRDKGEQWAEARQTVKGPNIGVMPGLEYAWLDCDGPETVERVRAGLQGLGILPVEIQPPPGGRHEGGRHFPLRVADVPAGLEQVRILPAVGPGELMTGRANVVVPCSRLPRRGAYQFVTGSPQAIGELPVIHFGDLAWLVPVAVVPIERIRAVPVQLFRRAVPARARVILRAARGKAGQPVFVLDSEGKVAQQWRSRSDAEYSALQGLILAGLSFVEISAVFTECWPGHYADKGAYRQDYLEQSYSKALAELASDRNRQAIAAEWRRTEGGVPGATTGSDWAVYRALLVLAWAAGSWQVRAAVRDISIQAAISVSTVHEALARLERAGLVRVMTPGGGTKAAVYDVSPASNPNIGHSLVSSVPGDPVDIPNGEVEGGPAWWVTPAELKGNVGLQELWAADYLGKSAGIVYGALGSNPLGARELGKQTGLSRRTIERALKVLLGVGLADRQEAGWVRGRVVTPALLVALQNATGAADSPMERWRRRRELVERQRENRLDELQRYKTAELMAGESGQEDTACDG